MDVYQEGVLDLFVARNGKLTVYRFTEPDQRGKPIEIPINSFVCWINRDKSVPNSVIEATGPGYYSKLIPGNFELVPAGVTSHKGHKIPPELLQAIEEADKRR